MSQPSEDIARGEFTVINSAGIHLRPCQMIARLASSFPDTEVMAGREDRWVNAKSIMGLTELLAACGDSIAFEMRGPRAAEALGKMQDLFVEGFGEPIDPKFQDNGKG